MPQPGRNPMIKTVSLEKAKDLKEAGFRQDTGMYWFKHAPLSHVLVGYSDYELDKPGIKDYIAAPTTDELLEELPHSFGERWYLDILGYDDYYRVIYRRTTQIIQDGEVFFKIENKKSIDGKELPEALASMYIFLKKEGLI